MKYFNVDKDMICGELQSFTIPKESDKKLLAQYKRIGSGFLFGNGDTVPLYIARCHTGNVKGVKK